MPEIALSSERDEAAFQVASAGVGAFNDARGVPGPAGALTVVLRDGPDAPPLGALTGYAYANWLYVDRLYVPEALRGAGWGGRMLSAAEAEARARGLTGVRLDTYSPTARAFYERRGYRTYGVLPDCPPGGERVCLAKRLDDGDA